MALTIDQARAVYDRIGRAQDWQAFYEDPTADRLLAHAAIGDGAAILEFGCGTGRLASRLLADLPEAHYLGMDLSPVMIELTRSRLAPFGDRARAVLVDGSLPLPAEEASADVVVSTFVFDLLHEQYAVHVLDDLRRVLAPDGRLCLAGLSPGVRPAERLVSRTWTAIWRLAPQLVGGCRPTNVAALLDERWQVHHRSRVHSWGLVTEVVIATPTDSAG